MIRIKMFKLNRREQNIITMLLRNESMQSSDIHDVLKNKEEISLVTVKRTLSEMTDKGLLTVFGSGRSTGYQINSLGRIFSEIDAKEYISTEPDKRYGMDKYNFELFSSFPEEVFIEEELKNISELTLKYREKVKEASPTIRKKELERLTIELSWKSSKIEGNTYTLLDTEKLILENKDAEGKTKEETQMILNHKEAFLSVYENKNFFKTITRENLEETHKLLTKNLDVGFGLRKSPVGISGSLYRPLDNIYQIEEALNNLIKTINRLRTPYAKALITLLGISYIQPFEDGNKRTSRIMADALLMAADCAPLSYRSVSEKNYKEATLVFYELNSITSFKKMFIEQYEFAAKNYSV
jgi:Fic family protein/predicted transcriptional regulator